jgi:nucleoside-diphosphate-sugar epimerase
MADWTDRRVLVTGARGFLGAPLAAALRARGARVVGTSRRPPAAAQDGWIAADFSDLAQARAAMSAAAPDVVYHLSSLADARRDVALVEATVRDEVVATANLLAASNAAGVGRVVLAGSFETPLPGESPSSPYAAAKAASGIYARLFQDLYGLPVVRARIFMAYGPGQPEGKLIPSATRALCDGLPLTVESTARALDWIHVDDVVAGLVASGEVAGIAGREIDLGTGRLTTVRDVVESLRALCAPEARLAYAAASSRGPEVSRCADLAATRALLGWQPAITLADGLRAWVAHWRTRRAPASRAGASASATPGGAGA